MQGAEVGERGLQVDGGGAWDFPRILLTENPLLSVDGLLVELQGVMSG